MKISRWRPKRPYRFLIASNLISFSLCIYSLLGRAGILLFYLPRFLTTRKRKKRVVVWVAVYQKKEKKNQLRWSSHHNSTGGGKWAHVQMPSFHTPASNTHTQSLLKIYLSLCSSRAPSHFSLFIFWLDYVVARASRQQFIGRHRDISAGTWLERRRRWASPGCSADIPPVAIFPLLLQRCLWLWLYSPSLSLTGKDKTFK
jgi:hypothetical protein